MSDHTTLTDTERGLIADSMPFPTTDKEWATLIRALAETGTPGMWFAAGAYIEINYPCDHVRARDALLASLGVTP